MDIKYCWLPGTYVNKAVLAKIPTEEVVFDVRTDVQATFGRSCLFFRGFLPIPPRGQSGSFFIREPINETTVISPVEGVPWEEWIAEANAVTICDIARAGTQWQITGQVFLNQPTALFCDYAELTPTHWELFGRMLSHIYCDRRTPEYKPGLAVGGVSSISCQARLALLGEVRHPADLHSASNGLMSPGAFYRELGLTPAGRQTPRPRSREAYGIVWEFLESLYNGTNRYEIRTTPEGMPDFRTAQLLPRLGMLTVQQHSDAPQPSVSIEVSPHISTERNPWWLWTAGNLRILDVVAGRLKQMVQLKVGQGK